MVSTQVSSEAPSRELATFLSERDGVTQLKTHWLFESNYFKGPVAVVVIANILQIGLSVDFRGGSWDTLWEITEYVFATLFGFEMVIKIILLKVEYFKDRWNLLDFVLAWLAIADAVTTAIGVDDATNKFTMLRILRLTRILRTFRLFKIFKELIILVEVILKSLKTMAWLLLLVTLLLYIFAIAFVDLIGSDKSYPAYSTENLNMDTAFEDFNNFQYFGTVLRSMYSLFNLLTLSEWSTITRPISEAQPPLIILMGFYTMIAAYGIMNVLIGIMVEHALTANTAFVQAKEADRKLTQMRLINNVALRLSEKDDDGNITWAEFETSIHQDEKLAELLRGLDLPMGCTIDDLFVLIDNDGDGCVTKDEFEACMHRMLYCNDFQRLCVMQISLNNIKRLVNNVDEVVREVREFQEHNTNGGAINSATKNSCLLSSKTNTNSAQDDKSELPEGKNVISKAADAKFTGPDQIHSLQAELREMRAEMGMFFANLQAVCLQSVEHCLAPPYPQPRGSREGSTPPKPMGLPPTFPCKLTSNPKWPGVTTLTADLPAMMPMHKHTEDANTKLQAPQLQGFALQAEVLGIISTLEARVGELQKHTELELSIRKHDLECQHATRTCCSELASCLTKKLIGLDNPSTSSRLLQKKAEFSL